VLRLRGLCILLLLSTASLGQCIFPAAQSSNLLSYSFEPLVATNGMALRVILQFRGGPTGRTKLELPSEWAEQQHAQSSITELKALSAETMLGATQSPSEKELHSTPGAPVRISYVLVKDWNGPLDSDSRFRADLSPDYFHIVGINSLVHPELDLLSIVDVQFDWQKLPAGWSLATSFGIDDRCQSFHGMWSEAVNSLFVGGDYRIYYTKVSGNALNFAIRGKWTFTDDEWVTQVRRIVEFERTFWHDNDFPYFLVTLTPLGQDHGSIAGTALTNAFMEHLSRLDPLSPSVLGNIAHETFHGWDPYKMGNRSGSDYPVSWFFEGFTHYYQDLILYRAGLVTFPDYVATVNEKLRHYETNEGTDVSLQEFIRRHSPDQSVLNQLDHRRGAVIAAWLDATIRHESGGRSSLDNLMFDMVNENAAYRHRHRGRPMALTNKRIFRRASKYIHRNSRKRLRQYVEEGGSIPIPVNALGPCVQSGVEMGFKFDLGFDRRSTKSEDKLVSLVEPGSEAWKAGLRDGQKLAGWSFNFGDASKPVRLTIKTAQYERAISYYPRGPEVSIQRLTLDSGRYSLSPEMCVAEIRPSLPRVLGGFTCFVR
jgi:predicted metalloprotease with PDZ domain